MGVVAVDFGLLFSLLEQGLLVGSVGGMDVGDLVVECLGFRVGVNTETLIEHNVGVIIIYAQFELYDKVGSHCQSWFRICIFDNYYAW